MASTYVNDLRLNEMATGDASGSWGTVTNTNLELIGEAFSYGTETIGDADSTLTIADGASDPVRSFFLKITSSVDLTTTRIVTLAPNTVSKVWMIENATTGSQVITIKQGSGATINVPNGQVKMISTDGAGSGGAVLDLLVDVDLTGTTTLVNLDVSGAVDIAGDLTLSAGGDGALRFTAASSVKVLDNNAAALVFEEADNAYMTFVTTDGSEAVKFDKALDINAATQIDATVTVGVDDTGYDVKLFGATTGKSLLWDESADSLIVTGSTSLQGGLEVGVDDTGYDVKFFGATAGAYMLWDESADDLILGGAAGLSVNSTALVTGVLTTTAATVHTGGITMPANAKAIFGAGSDLQIYHNGTNSIISDEGAGALVVQSNGSGIYLNNGVSENMLTAVIDGAVTLYHDNAAKLATTATGIDVTGTVAAGAGTALLPSITTTGDLNTGMWFPAADTIAFSEGGVEALRIDSSGNVLVGKTADDVTVVGTQINYNGFIGVTRSANITAVFNRTTSDGDIVSFRKDGTTAGSIGTYEGTTVVAGKHTGLKFNYTDATNSFIHTVSPSGVVRDAVDDLGYAESRFKDLYLSGGVYLGGTGSANYLDDYEEGTFTPYFAGSGATGVFGYSTQSGYYEKVGNICHAHGYLVCNSVTSNFSGTLRLSGLPFTNQNLTNNYSSVNIGYSTSWATAAPQAGHTEPNQTFAPLKYYGTEGNTGDLTAGIAASDGIIFSITYRTA
jgi:hypothetical protein